MPWTPTYNVINARSITDNLLAYFAANQVDALNWANGGSGLKSFQKFSDSVANRNTPVYPAIAYSDDNDALNFGDGGIDSGIYVVSYEVMVQNPNPDVATSEARKYARAISSMIRNCPASTLMANTDADAVVIDTLEVGFDPIKTNATQNDFMQTFQVRATYLLTAGNQ
jgi:hypothetical protein